MYIETDCTIEHEGRSYESGGAVVTDDFLIAYPSEKLASGFPHWRELHDWHGRTIGRWRVISSRRAVFFGHLSWQGDRYYYMRAVVNGRRYSLRGFGTGMIAKGKALAS